MRRRLKVTRAGQIFVVITFAVGFGALNTSNNLLFLCLGLMLSLITVSGILSELNVVDLVVTLPNETLLIAKHEGDYEFSVENRHARRVAFAVSVRVKWQRQGEPSLNDRMLSDSVEARSKVLVLNPGQTRSLRGALEFSERGDYRLKEVLLQTEYPFGFFQKTRVVHLEARVLVAPEPLPYAPEVPSPRQAHGEVEAASRGQGDDIFDLREAAPNADIRRIAWAKSAARGRLVEVTRTSEWSDALIVAVRHQQESEPFELALRQAAGLVRSRLAKGQRTALLTGEGDSALGAGPQHERALLTMLALAQTGAAKEPASPSASVPTVWVG